MFSRFQNLVPSLWAYGLLKYAMEVVGDAAIPDGDQTQYQDIAEWIVKGFAKLKAAMPDR
jgi:hypothetical protein